MKVTPASDFAGATTRLADPLEHFVEELWVSAALFAAYDFDVVVDPCAGFGNVVRSARAAGLAAYGSDIVKRAPFIAGGADFFAARWRAPARAGQAFALVSNPPFGRVRAFCRVGLERAPVVAALTHVEKLTAAVGWAEELGLARVLAVAPRPSMWPGEIYARKLAAGEKLGNGRRNVAWLIFERGRRGAPTFGWARRPA